MSGPLLIDGRAPLAGYGRGWFRIGTIEHRGSLLVLPQGVYGWPVDDPAAITEASLREVLDMRGAAGFLLLGTGAAQVFPDRALRQTFAAAGLGLEAMDTGAACRTYNVLLAEERVFAAALIAMP
ncbi:MULTISPECIES: Mth938-like domain-containing protein [Rhodomicrobium]|uniref:Mth938-like domain-containing protein n=1 Tax=Rhodomicrobium TaxID=1068 RepID=UPI000B4B2D6C|nr:MULTISPECIES: Mth938-like domain-containing protein [Rhodomicrobium]